MENTANLNEKLEGRVLIVDDSQIFRKDIKDVANKFKLSNVEAVDGQEALDILKADQNFNVVLCDIKMPRMTGLELLEAIRKIPALEKMPFLVITTESEMADIMKAKSLGASGWLIKPLSPEAISDVLRRFSSKKS